MRCTSPWPSSPTTPEVGRGAGRASRSVCSPWASAGLPNPEPWETCFKARRLREEAIQANCPRRQSQSCAELGRRGMWRYTFASFLYSQSLRPLHSIHPLPAPRWQLKQATTTHSCSWGISLLHAVQLVVGPSDSKPLFPYFPFLPKQLKCTVPERALRPGSHPAGHQKHIGQGLLGGQDVNLT